LIHKKNLQYEAGRLLIVLTSENTLIAAAAAAQPSTKQFTLILLSIKANSRPTTYVSPFQWSFSRWKWVNQ